MQAKDIRRVFYVKVLSSLPQKRTFVYDNFWRTFPARPIVTKYKLRRYDPKHTRHTIAFVLTNIVKELLAKLVFGINRVVFFNLVSTEV